MPITSIEDKYNRAPLPTDDKSKGYLESWFWEDQSTNRLYKCFDSTIGAAI